MRLPVPSTGYNASRESERNRQLETADRENHKRGRDVEISPGRLIIQSPDGTRWSITVNNSGVVSATSL